MKEEIITESDSDTFYLGEQIARHISAGDVLALYGELGAGKTTLIKGICKGFNVDEQVTSPSFVIMNIFKGTIPVYHFDFYRTTSDWDMKEFDLDDYFYGGGLTVIEWADKIQDLLPEERKEITISYLKNEKNKRRFKLNNFNENIRD